MFIVNDTRFPAATIHTSFALADLPPNFKMPYPGLTVSGFDPIFGHADFMLVFGVASALVGDAMLYTPPGYLTVRAVAATRGLLGISMAANTSTTSLSWLGIRGALPVRVATAVVAGVNMSLTATAGALDDAVTANQQIDGAFVGSIASSATITTTTAQTVNTSTDVAVNSIDGMFVGATVTGTGIPASTTITAIGYGGQFPGLASPVAYHITLSAAATATGTITLTVTTGTGFCIGAFNAPSAAALA